MRERVGLIASWLVARASRVWPVLVVIAVVASAWSPLRDIRIREFRSVFHHLDAVWLAIALDMTLVNIAVMGFYDVIAFRHTRTNWMTRWRYGAVAFAWSNFLTLGPLAGPAVRFLLYRHTVDSSAELQCGVMAVAMAFTSGLAGWLVAVFAATLTGTGLLGTLAFSVVAVPAVVILTRVALRGWRRFRHRVRDLPGVLELAAIGWLDWLLAALVWAACVRATGGQTTSAFEVLRTFLYGQGIGIASFVPGGLGSSDAFWVAHLTMTPSTAAAALMAYRGIYYLGPWVVASLILLTWLNRRSPRRLELARRVVAGLVGGGGVLLLLSSASPALQARLPILQRLVPLGVVELGMLAASVAGVLLVVLARGLARGYHSAFRATMVLLTLAGIAALMKGLDWEEAATLLLIALAARSQAALFDRPRRHAWLERSDLVLAGAALALFVLFGIFSFHLRLSALTHWTAFGYALQSPRFVRAALAMAFAIAAAGSLVMMREPRRFTRLGDEDIDHALSQLDAFGTTTHTMIVATGDKELFTVPQLGFCLYRTMGPYLMVFADPVVRADGSRAVFLEQFFAFAAEQDRRPVFYQVSPEWMPDLHDRGYAFFKVGEEADVRLSDVTLTGHAGKLNRQILRRAERDGLSFRVLERDEVTSRMAELADVSDDWLRARDGVERQFSVGFFDAEYLRRFRCAVVEDRERRIVGFANLLEGPRHVELSVDLMRYRRHGPGVMEFMVLSLLLEGQRLGYRRFNLGMAPLAEVGAQRDAHRRERLAHVLFRRGEQWYNFQGLRFFKQKFGPVWHPRYMAYQYAWEWPVVGAYLGALTAGGWRGLLASRGRRVPSPPTSGHKPTLDAAPIEA